MCLALALFSLAPVLSGYVIYLAVAVVITEGSPAVQITLTAILLAALLLGLGQLTRLQRVRRRGRSSAGPDGVSELE